MQMHDAAGGIVDIDQERAFWPSMLEPGVFAAVDLDFLGHIQTMDLAQLRACQRWAEVLVAAANQAQGHLGDIGRKSVIAGLATPARNDAGRTFIAYAVDQSLDLPARQR